MDKNRKKEVLALIPARYGSKRIPQKNIRSFLGKPLIAYTIEQALSNKIIDRVIVDTDSEIIAKIARRYGAEVPFLRPPELASDTAQVADSFMYFLNRLKADENYVPTHVIILQTTSPLRKHEDIYRCWDMMCKTNATTILTVCPTHPRLYHLSPESDLIQVNKMKKQSSNTQAWPKGYVLNGCFVYLVEYEAMMKEQTDMTKKIKAVICPRWRSVDLDTPEDWAMAEFLYRNKERLTRRLKQLEK